MVQILIFNFCLFKVLFTGLIDSHILRGVEKKSLAFSDVFFTRLKIITICAFVKS